MDDTLKDFKIKFALDIELSMITSIREQSVREELQEKSNTQYQELWANIQMKRKILDTFGLVRVWCIALDLVFMALLFVGYRALQPLVLAALFPMLLSFLGEFALDKQFSDKWQPNLEIADKLEEQEMGTINRLRDAYIKNGHDLDEVEKLCTYMLLRQEEHWRFRRSVLNDLAGH